MSKAITNQFAEDLGYTYGGWNRGLIRFSAPGGSRGRQTKLPLFFFFNQSPYLQFLALLGALFTTLALRTVLFYSPS